MSDAELLQRMVTSHSERYGETFWEFFYSSDLPLMARGQQTRHTLALHDSGHTEGTLSIAQAVTVYQVRTGPVSRCTKPDR